MKDEESRYAKVKMKLQEEHKKKVAALKDSEEIKAEKYVLKNHLFDAEMTHESRVQEIKDAIVNCIFQDRLND